MGALDEEGGGEEGLEKEGGDQDLGFGGGMLKELVGREGARSLVMAARRSAVLLLLLGFLGASSSIC